MKAKFKLGIMEIEVDGDPDDALTSTVAVDPPCLESLSAPSPTAG